MYHPCIGISLRGGTSPGRAGLGRTWFRVYGLGFRVQGLWVGVQGSGFRVQGLEFRVQDSGFRVQVLGFRV